MTARTYRLPVDVGLVPSNQTGVYWFGLAIPAAHLLGLHASSSSEDRRRGQAELVATLERFAKVYSTSELTGRLRDNRHRHLAVALDIVATGKRLVGPARILGSWLHSAKDGDAREMLQALRRISECLPPIYVGLAYDQSLADRLSDHLEGRTNLIGHLKKTNLQWQDLYYRCITLEALDKVSYRILEKTLQSLYRPVFSNR